MSAEAMKMVAIGMVMGIGIMLPAVAIGWIGSAAMNALGRNPEAQGALLTNMKLSIAFAESVGIYCLITAILLVFEV